MEATWKLTRGEDSTFGFVCTFDRGAPNGCQFKSDGWPNKMMCADRAGEHQREHETGRMAAIWKAKADRKLDEYYSARDDDKDRAYDAFVEAEAEAIKFKGSVQFMTELDSFKVERGWNSWMSVAQYLDENQEN